MKCKSFFFKTLACVMILFVLMGMVSAGVVFADEDMPAMVTDDGFEYSISDGEITIVSYKGNYTDLVIPEEIVGLPVTTIHPMAFSLFTYDGVNFNVTPYESVFIPKTVTKIEMNPFCSYTFLDSITVDEDNPVYDSREDCNAIIETATNTLIAGCNKTVIPDGVEKIDAGAFVYCDELKEVVIPESVKEIGEYAFYYCSGLEKLTIKADIENFVSVFDGALKELALLGNIENIEGDFGSVDTLIISKNVKSVAENCFPIMGSVKNVVYEGTEDDWANIEIGKYNTGLIGAEITFDYTIEDEEKDSAADAYDRRSSGRDNDDDGNGMLIVIIAAAGAVVLLGVGAVIAVIAVKKKKASKAAENTQANE